MRERRLDDDDVVDQFIRTSDESLMLLYVLAIMVICATTLGIALLFQ